MGTARAAFLEMLSNFRKGENRVEATNALLNGARSVPERVAEPRVSVAVAVEESRDDVEKNRVENEVRADENATTDAPVQGKWPARVSGTQDNTYYVRAEPPRGTELGTISGGTQVEVVQRCFMSASSKFPWYQVLQQKIGWTDFQSGDIDRGWIYGKFIEMQNEEDVPCLSKF